MEKITGERVALERTQSEIHEYIESIIPPVLWNKYKHLSFGEMAEQPELEDWQEELLQAEEDSHKAQLEGLG